MPHGQALQQKVPLVLIGCSAEAGTKHSLSFPSTCQSFFDILIGLLEAVVEALFMNIYIVGLNQLFDIEID